MPIYEYKCRKCGRVVEVIQKFSDRPLRKCRSCSGKLDKLISRSSFTLKGGGWYAEGYSGNGKKSGSQTSDASKSSSPKSSSPKSSSSGESKDSSSTKAAAAAN